MSLDLEWEERLDKTHEVFERYRASGFELVATIITLSAGVLGIFHTALASWEKAILFLPIIVAVFQQRCRYEGLKEYAHARYAAAQLRVIGELIKREGTGKDPSNIAKEKDTLVEYLNRNRESNVWFGRADHLCDLALALFFAVGLILFFRHIVPAICCA